MPFEITLRAAGAAVLLLTATVLLLSAPRSAAARTFAGFALGAAGFLGANTAFDAAELPEPLWSVASFCSRMATVALWMFCLALFDARPRAAAAAAVIGAWFALVAVSKGYFAPPPAGFDVSAVQIVFGAGLILQAGWRVMRDLRGDLVERRRRARPAFALALLVFLALDFAVDAVQGYGWRPSSFLLAQNATIFGLAVGLALWMLRGDPALGVDRTPRRVSNADDPEVAIVAKIDALMQSARPYLDPGLTFATFAAQAGVPEPALRRAINHRLGHGHFRNFLNGYRVAEAKRRLRDPALTADKILAVALDSGFSSLASFNRVFRQLVGVTPSEYRAGAASNDS